MWFSVRFGAPLPGPSVPRHLLGMTIALLGVAIIVSARMSFSGRETTFSPLHPSRATTLVTDGVFGFTRNPMYLGTWMALLGVGIMFGSWYAVGLSLVYVVWIDRLQIVPEERLLAAGFGEEYEAYRRTVRRWI
jgi:protein-S-isoprenylcysteine O-methyltransferase Ste14